MKTSISKVSEGRFTEARGDEFGNLCTSPPISGIPDIFYLTESDNNTPPFSYTGNYSVTPKDLVYTAVGLYKVYTLSIVISDDLTFNQSDYGGVVGGLTNGISTFFKPFNQSEIPLLNGLIIKKNNDWIALSGDTKLTQFIGTPQTLSVDVHIVQDYGIPLTMNAGDKIIFRLNDNFSSLLYQSFSLKGTSFF